MKYPMFREKLIGAIGRGTLDKFRVSRDGSVENKIACPKYFPAHDQERIAKWREKNFDDMRIDEKDYYKDMLEPSERPDNIFQGSFAISEDVPLTLDGIGPCIGVIIMNKRTGRTIAVHLEAREEKNEDPNYLKNEAKKFISMIKELFNAQPDRIVATSMILGTNSYHYEIIALLKKEFTEIEIEELSAHRVVINPKKKEIVATDLI